MDITSSELSGISRATLRHLRVAVETGGLRHYPHLVNSALAAVDVVERAVEASRRAEAVPAPPVIAFTDHAQERLLVRGMVYHWQDVPRGVFLLACVLAGDRIWAEAWCDGRSRRNAAVAVRKQIRLAKRWATDRHPELLPLLDRLVVPATEPVRVS
jgi:hypothetical protein